MGVATSARYSNGTAYNSNFYFYRNSQLTFYADAIGQHTLSFNISGQLSSQVTINVIAFVPPQNYLTPYNNYLTPYSYMTPNYIILDINIRAISLEVVIGLDFTVDMIGTCRTTHGLNAPRVALSNYFLMFF